MPTDPNRLRRRLGRSLGINPETSVAASGERAEIDQLIETMHGLEKVLGDCGLVGSGWQVAPRAMVSTANLLRKDQAYTVIDLESGIPAVLVPKYLLRGLLRGKLPPFDDLDANRIREWLAENEKLLLFRIGPERLRNLSSDVDDLIRHSENWKNTELALFRRPWRWLSPSNWHAYQAECYRRWRQNGIIGDELTQSIRQRPILARCLWWAGTLPGPIGKLAGRLIGNRTFRERSWQCIVDGAERKRRWRSLVERKSLEWAGNRIDLDEESPASTSNSKFIANLVLSKLLPASWHRFLASPMYRSTTIVTAFLLLVSARYQAWFGNQQIEKSIDRWQQSKRIDAEEAALLRSDSNGEEFRAYTRGFGMHLALKTLAPIVVPAKLGGVAAFLATGNPWFLAPVLITPLLRTCVTLTSWWSTRDQHVPHGEALIAGVMPVVGSLAFPIQMFSARPKLSIFLVRDAASLLGRRVPVYGGGDSRTEIAFIRATDFVIEVMQIVSQMIGRVLGVRRHEATETASRNTIPIQRGRLRRWIEREVDRRIAAADQNALETDSRQQSKAA